MLRLGLNTALCVVVNVALHKPAVQITTYKNFDASLAVDGKLRPSSCTKDAKNPYWSVDLGMPMDVARVCVTNAHHKTHGELCILQSTVRLFNELCVALVVYLATATK